MSHDTLEPIEPQEAIDMYLDPHRDEHADQTVQSHRSRLRYFADWCKHNNIRHMNELTGRACYEFRIWRRDDGDLKPVSLKTQLATLRAFLKWCESIDAVPERLYEKVLLPSLSDEENVDETMIEPEEVEALLDHLERFEYASFRHILFHTLWETGMRAGSVHSLDVSDFFPEKRALRLVHRPDTGTYLKNKDDANRFVAISNALTEVIQDYIDVTRPDVTIEYGREPLLATERGDGRPWKTHHRKTMYRITSPCYYTGECPHGRDIDDCEASTYARARNCPSSVSLHPIRRGAITCYLTEDTPKLVVSDRCDVDPGTLDRHYDGRSDEQRMENRRTVLGLDED